MRRPHSVPLWIRCLIGLVASCLGGSLRPATFEHLEARQVHPIRLTPDGHHLLAVDSPANRLCLFELSGPTGTSPRRVAEIPVGLEPTSVEARTADEFWVVNEGSDSVSVVSGTRRAVVATLECGDEPSDIAFAGDFAFVSCARNGRVRVFHAVTRNWITDIELRGLEPRAMTVDPEGKRLFVAFQHSGNQTTVLSADRAPAPLTPTNPTLPAPPQTALIVPASDTRVPFVVLDHDVAEISVETLQVTRTLSGAGTLLFDLALRPGTSELWVANTDARNLVRFEPVLRGHIADNRITRFNLASGVSSFLDLNPDVDYATLPNPTARERALAQPTSLIFNPDGTSLWVAAFGSDRVARIDATSGSIVDRVDLRRESRVDPPTQDEPVVRGPRALALDAARQRLYVLNKLANTLSVVATDTATVLAEFPVGSHDPTPAEVRRGRGYLFDARLSGNGTASCATCHPDTDRDGLAWDLGDPNGNLITVTGANLAAHDRRIRNRVMHPMKGPMMTQTLRGMSPTNQFHWRGDRPTLHHFNATFPDLLGGEPIASADIDTLQGYLNSVRHHPNPHRAVDGSLPPSLRGGNPTRGKALFDIHINHCAVCHEGSPGSNNNIDDPRNFGGLQPLKTPPLQTSYQRALLDTRPGATNVSGFGLGHDGSAGNQFLPTVHFYELDELGGQDFADVTSYVLSFDTGTHPAVGWNRTFGRPDLTNAPALASLATVEAQATFTNRCCLVVHGFLQGRLRTFQFDASLQAYLPDRATDPALTRPDLLAQLRDGDTLTFLAGFPSQIARLGLDRNGNGIPDGDETTPSLRFQSTEGIIQLNWSDAAAEWVLEHSAAVAGPWVTVPGTTSGDPTDSQSHTRNTTSGTGYFRLRRTW